MNLTVTNAEQAVALIEQLYLHYGQQTYEEKCTQLQHAEQCATLALEQGLGQECAVAAFLHDIGHLIADNLQLPEFNDYGLPNHDELGADYLARWGFSERIVMMIREHVQVKRYLSAIQPGYLTRLSHASLTTLSQQGGPMSAPECEQYGEQPFLADIIQLRNIDDSGKLPEMQCKPLSYWLACMPAYIALP